MTIENVFVKFCLVDLHQIITLFVLGHLYSFQPYNIYGTGQVFGQMQKEYMHLYYIHYFMFKSDYRHVTYI